MANEKRLIDAKDVLEILRHEADVCNSGFTRNVLEFVITRIDSIKTVDAVEVVHGRWKPHYETFDEDKAVGVWGGEYQTGWLCSVCGRYEPTEEPYCNCGTKMDGQEKDGNLLFADMEEIIDA